MLIQYYLFLFYRDLEKRDSYINKSFDDESPIRGSPMEEPQKEAVTSRPEPDVNDEVFDDVSENSRWDSEVSRLVTSSL